MRHLHGEAEVPLRLRISLAFGLFQAVMPVIGYLAGLSIRDLIQSVDHWIAFSLLAFIGCKMIYESLFMDGNGRGWMPMTL